MDRALDFRIPRLGEAKIASPMRLSKVMDDFIANYVDDQAYVIYDLRCDLEEERLVRAYERPSLMEKAGPREMVYFDPSKVCAAIVTCGGLCPGLNDVIRALVMTLWHHYGVKNILGIRHGYHGFLPENHFPPMPLSPELVSKIHQQGGTVLGSSRGGARTAAIVDALEQLNVNMLFTIGGDGTQRGALAICQEAAQRGRVLSVVGIPKTIDNDLSFVQRSFGFETAVGRAVDAVCAAHVEATGAVNGVGLVKVMGRESGFIAASTALASNDVNFVLVPEVPFDLEGENGFLAHLRRRLERRGHAVVLVAEGAGQHLAQAEGHDASGNRALGDIGTFLRDRIIVDAKEKGWVANLKYIDPSYIIRGTAANPNDSIYCSRLGAHAVHAAMTGRTAMLVSLVNDVFVHIPMALSVAQRNRIDPESSLWRDVVIATGQPALMVNSR